MPAPAAAWTIAVAETPSAQQGNVLGAARAPCEAMLDVCTRNDAHALNQVDEIGLRATGKCADIILIDRDVLMVPVTKGISLAHREARDFLPFADEFRRAAAAKLKLCNVPRLPPAADV